MKKLRHLRKLAGLTQIELSRRAAIDRVRLSFAENGHVELSEGEQTRLMKVIVRAAKENDQRRSKLLDDKVLIAACE